MKSLLIALTTAGLLLGPNPSPLHSQETTATLHVYVNLIQIPVLTLVGSPKFDSNLKFAVSIDSGSPFPVTHIRPQGNDPITLAILLDLSGDQSDLIPRLNDAIAGLAPDYLRPRDHVSVYAVDCQLVQLADDVPADATQLKRAIDEAIQSPQVHGPGTTHPACGTSLHLWDALTYLTDQLSDLPGRLVILAVTDGHDSGSTHRWVDLKNYADYSGVAIFGLATAANRSPYSDGPLTPDFDGFENKFGIICQLSGGQVLLANKRNLDSRLKEFVTELRDRVIIEFPRPDALSANPHSILVTATNRNGFQFPSRFIRPSGFSVPIADPATLANPNTVPTDPANAPTIGKRGILTPSN
jgi:hypothetical protein